jgi:hypothetical protein
VSKKFNIGKPIFLFINSQSLSSLLPDLEKELNKHDIAIAEVNSEKEIVLTTKNKVIGYPTIIYYR